MSEKKDDLTEIDATILDHPGKIRLPSSIEVQSAIDAVPTVEEQRKPGTATPQLQRPIKVVLPVSNPTIPIEPARRFDLHPTSPTLPGFSSEASRDPTIRESSVPPPPPLAASTPAPAPAPSSTTRLVPVLAAALAVAIAVIVYLITRK